MGSYIVRLRWEVTEAASAANQLGCVFERRVDSIYLGGGTPTTLAPEHLREIFAIVHGEFEVSEDAEITVEAAPGTLTPEILGALTTSRVNRVSLGVQSFVDQEIRSVGRLHSATTALMDIERLREFGIGNINVDLIAGLPHQSVESWRCSLERLAIADVPHASIYILEIDEDSRLGRELIAGGSRYHAHAVPDSDLAADLYLEAIQALSHAGLEQYEISNFARVDSESRHNLKYWTRKPYLGFGLDAHSMLYARPSPAKIEAIRFGSGDDLTSYIAGKGDLSVTRVSREEAIEETLFLGLRLNRGISLSEVDCRAVNGLRGEINELTALGLLDTSEDTLRLTPRGRLLSNEVFGRFIPDKVA